MTSLEPLFDQFLLAAFTMATPTVWCLTIDHENKPTGPLFKVILENHIGNLRDKVNLVKEEILNFLKDIDACDLVVWRCKGKQVFDDEDSGKLELQVRAVFSKKEVTKLSGTRKINQLKLSDSEVLLIQVPGASFSFNPAILK